MNRAVSNGDVHVEMESGGGPSSQEWRENYNVHMICPDCRESPPNLVEEFSSGDMVCGSCGLVLASHIVDTRSEWRTFNNDDGKGEDPSRVGAAPDALFSGSQLTSEISMKDTKGGSAGRSLMRAQRLATANKSNEILSANYSQINALSSSIGLPTLVIRTANYLYKIVEENKAFRGKSQESIIAGCIFIACRQHQAGRSFKEIVKLTSVPKKEIGRTFKSLERFFRKINLEKSTQVIAGLVVEQKDYNPTSHTEASELCHRFCSELGLSNIAQSISAQLAERMVNFGALAGRSPLSIAAACIYMTAHLLGEARSPKEIAVVAGVSDGTIRSAYKNVYADREKLISPEWLTGKRGGDMSRLPSI